MPNRLKWWAIGSLVLGAAQVLGGLAVAVVPKLGEKLDGKGPVVGVAMIVLGALLLTFAIRLLMKKRRARFVLFGLFAVALGAPALGQFVAMATAPAGAPGGSAVGPVLMLGLLGIFAWASFSARTRAYFGEPAQGRLARWFGRSRRPALPRHPA
ncbi:MAG TPA: AcrB/AcrD/AcrF family protein, partial [Dyella sp.]|nr:AcrB/AcrD/AcrF family protein [Dyella sp.]